MLKSTCRKLSMVLFASFALTLLGCQQLAPERAEKTTFVLALDTSKSAKNIHESLFNRLRNDMVSLERNGRLILFRFDSLPAEFYDGEVILDEAEAGTKIRPELGRTSNTNGTNLAKLLTRVDKLVGDGASSAVDLRIYTDCGTEMMTEADNEVVSKICERWQTLGNRKISFHGVSSGHRETLRDLIPWATID